MEPIEEQELVDLRNILSVFELKVLAVKIKKSETTTRNALKHGIGTSDTWKALRKFARKINPDFNQKRIIANA